jgi:predicted nucleic acid-binding protein
MRIVADTGPIIALSKIGKIFLLKSIAGEVLIPPMVHKELFGKIGSESNEIDRALTWTSQNQKGYNKNSH